MAELTPQDKSRGAKRVVAIVQARMTSSRLPGKVLMPLAGRTVLDCVLDRVAVAHGIDAICVAVPEGAAHDPIVAHLAGRPGIIVARGPELDVLSRFEIAADLAAADVVVRVTSDCPAISPRLISAAVAMQQATEACYVATAPESGFPLGFDVEAFPRSVLACAAREAVDTYEREHVTSFIWRRPERFAALFIDRKPDLRHLRLVVDTPDDYRLQTAIAERLGGGGFDLEEILALLQREPALAAINSHVPQTPYERRARPQS